MNSAKTRSLKITLNTMRIWDILYRLKHQTDKGDKIGRNHLVKQNLTTEAIYWFFKMINRLLPLCIIETN